AEERKLVLALERPTAAEAMLDAMDRHLADPEARPYSRKDYLESVVRLGDRRGVPLLKRRPRGAGAGERRPLCHAHVQMGDKAPLAAYAKDFEKGTLGLALNEDSGKEIFAAVHILIEARQPACDKALLAMAKPDHWAHTTARAVILGDGGSMGVDIFDRH